MTFVQQSVHSLDPTNVHAAPFQCVVLGVAPPKQRNDAVRIRQLLLLCVSGLEA